MRGKTQKRRAISNNTKGQWRNYRFINDDLKSLLVDDPMAYVDYDLESIEIATVLGIDYHPAGPTAPLAGKD